jgi:hypothetical protein
MYKREDLMGGYTRSRYHLNTFVLLGIVSRWGKYCKLWLAWEVNIKWAVYGFAPEKINGDEDSASLPAVLERKPRENGNN